MVNELVLQEFKKRYPDYKIPGHILLPDDDIALYKYSRGTVLEIGSYLGGSAAILSIKANKVYTIDQFCKFGGLYDNDENYRYEKVKENLLKFKNIELIKGLSSEVGINNTFDVIFIDGSHEWPDVNNDYLKWSKQLREGGHILFHDCREDYPAILRVCREIQERNEMKFIEKIGIINIFKGENNGQKKSKGKIRE